MTIYLVGFGGGFFLGVAVTIAVYRTVAKCCEVVATPNGRVLKVTVGRSAMFAFKL